MPWFPVDDGFAFHPKAAAAGDAALGLWVRAGSYSARYLTEGFLSHADLKQLRAKPSQVRALVDARLWVEVDGGVQFHEWTENGNRSRAQVEADRAAAAERKRRQRSRQTDPPPDPDGMSRRESRRDSENGHAVSHAAQARPGQATTPLLTLVGRLAVSDARGTAPPPAELVALWQDIAGPGVDLEDEARAYLERNLNRPADDEAAAWVGWLRKGAERRAHQPVDRPDCRTPGCYRGWLADDPDGRPQPCPTCRPHLRAVPNPTTEAS